MNKRCIFAWICSIRRLTYRSSRLIRIWDGIIAAIDRIKWELLPYRIEQTVVFISVWEARDKSVFILILLWFLILWEYSKHLFTIQSIGKTDTFGLFVFCLLTLVCIFYHGKVWFLHIYRIRAKRGWFYIWKVPVFANSRFMCSSPTTFTKFPFPIFSKPDTFAAHRNASFTSILSRKPKSSILSLPFQIQRYNIPKVSVYSPH